ncbi:MAG TPA: hypothetical protein ACFYEK_08435 [Candidatus Wunengus sp. YC60]|uniref:hypothetical protein n=1 Tax=Candidatus Wunengus sp. YC60 TaxID=3367697 RepID=UPI0040251F21
MKVFKPKKLLSGIVMMFALAFITDQASFAAGENTSDSSSVAQTGEQNLASSSQGGAGIVRSRIPGKIRKGLRESDKAAKNLAYGGTVQVFAAFGSNTAADVSTGDVNVVPVVAEDSAYLYVAFRVTSAMKVDIEWYLDGSTTPIHTETGFEDPDGGGDLTSGFWYFAWFNPSSITTGLHSIKIKVRESSSGSWFQDSCKVLVTH